MSLYADWQRSCPSPRPRRDAWPCRRGSALSSLSCIPTGANDTLHSFPRILNPIRLQKRRSKGTSLLPKLLSPFELEEFFKRPRKALTRENGLQQRRGKEIGQFGGKGKPLLRQSGGKTAVTLDNGSSTGPGRNADRKKKGKPRKVMEPS